jgi:hypothetical protein
MQTNKRTRRIFDKMAGVADRWEAGHRSLHSVTAKSCRQASYLTAAGTKGARADCNHKQDETESDMNLIRQYIKVAGWVLRGRPAPPPHFIKQKLLIENARRWHTPVMVETGTLHGDMIEAMKDHFEELYSIEISPEFAAKAQQRFANSAKIRIIENDSAIALQRLVPELHRPSLFWLDGHYSGGNTGKGAQVTPVLDELSTIYASDLDHVVLIDDARLFGTDKDYPSLEKLTSHIRKLRPDATISMKNDCIQITPQRR